jgi:hypothetical protein
MKPRLLPTSLFLALAKRGSAKLLRKDILEFYPRQAQRTEGIAEGPEIDMISYHVPACTSLWFSAENKKGWKAREDHPMFFPYDPVDLVNY